jgi:hypothetical protein
MSLDNIQLPPITVQQLFRKSLVELKTTQAAAEKETVAATLNILGKNQKGILIAVNNSEAAFLQDDELNFLLGILSACKLNMDDVGILNINKHPDADYKKLSAELNAEKVFLFGIDAGEINLPLSFPQYQIQQYNGQTYLSAPPLSALQNDKAEKTKLWNCLKQIFSI